MLGKQPQAVIEKLAAGTRCSGNQTWFSDAAPSPTSPLDYESQSPRGLRKYSYDLGGVGLAIVASLEKSDNPRYQIQATNVVFVQNLTRSNPIPVQPTSKNGCFDTTYNGGELEESEMMDDSLEDYTFVTCHGPNKSYTRVYGYNGSDYGRTGHEKVGFDRRSRNYGFPVFHISPPARFEDDHFTAYPTSDFLNSCNLCQKKLHGKDIYMYRGERAFCSTECRNRQIVMDERKEMCSSEAISRSAADVSNSPYANGQIFSTGILAI